MVNGKKLLREELFGGADSSHTAGSTIEAGLPNITGDNGTGLSILTNDKGIYNGAFYYDGESESRWFGSNMASDINYHSRLVFDASKSNPIYGNSTTVQTPAYVVTYWQRTE